MDPEEDLQGAPAPAPAPAAPQRFAYRRVTPEGESIEVLDQSNPEDAAVLRALAGTPGIEQVLTPLEAGGEVEAELLRRGDVQQAAERSTALEGAALGVANALTFGQTRNLAERFGGNTALLEGVERGQTAVVAGTEIAADLLAAVATGGASLGEAGAANFFAGGLSQAAANSIERAALSRLARTGLSQGTRRFLAGSLANVGTGLADIGVRAGLEYAITGRPIEAEQLLGSGALVAALGLGFEGLAAVGRGARGLGRRLPQEALEQARTLSDTGFGTEQGARAVGDYERGFLTADQPPPTPIISDFWDNLIGSWAGGLDRENVAHVQRAAQHPEAFVQSARQRMSRDIADRLQSVYEYVQGAGAQSVTNRATRLEGIRAAYAGADGDAVRETLAQSLSGIATANRGLVGRQREVFDGVLQRLGRALDTEGDAAAVVEAIDGAIDDLTQSNVLRQARTGPGSEASVAAVEQALEAAIASPALSNVAVDPSVAARIERSHRLLQDFRLRDAFEEAFTRPGGSGRRRADAAAVQQAFDEDALRATSPRNRQELETWIRTVDGMLEAEAEAVPARAAEILERRRQLAGIFESSKQLRDVSQANAAVREAGSVESKNAQLMAGMGFGFAGGAIGTAVGGPVGTVVGAGIGLALGALTHPVGALRRAAAIKSWFRRGETRAASSLGRLRSSLRPRGPSFSSLQGADISAARRGLPRLAARLMDPERGEEEYRAVREQLRAALTPERLQTLAGGLGEINPDLATNAILGLQSGAGYLASTLPPAPGEGTLWGGPAARGFVPRADILALARRVAVAEDAWHAVDLAAAGRLTPEHAEAFRALYPALHAATASYVAEMVAELDEPPPYQTRMQVNLLLGLTDDPTLDPAFIARLQRPRAQTQQQAQAAGPRASASLMSSVSDAYGTTTQRITAGL